MAKAIKGLENIAGTAKSHFRKHYNIQDYKNHPENYPEGWGSKHMFPNLVGGTFALMMGSLIQLGYVGPELTFYSHHVPPGVPGALAAGILSYSLLQVTERVPEYLERCVQEHENPADREGNK